MADYDFAKIEKKLSKYLDEDRFQHFCKYCYIFMALTFKSKRILQTLW